MDESGVRVTRYDAESQFVESCNCDEHGPFEHPYKGAQFIGGYLGENLSVGPQVVAYSILDVPAQLAVEKCLSPQCGSPRELPKYSTWGPGGASAPPFSALASNVSGEAIACATFVASGTFFSAVNVAAGYNVSIRNLEGATNNSWLLRYLLLRVPVCKGNVIRLVGNHLANKAAYDKNSASLLVLIDYGFAYDSSSKDSDFDQFVSPHVFLRRDPQKMMKNPEKNETKRLASKMLSAWLSKTDSEQEENDGEEVIETTRREYTRREYTYSNFLVPGVAAARGSADCIEVWYQKVDQGSPSEVQDSSSDLANRHRMPCIDLHQTKEQYNTSVEDSSPGIHWWCTPKVSTASKSIYWNERIAALKDRFTDSKTESAKSVVASSIDEKARLSLSPVMVAAFEGQKHVLEKLDKLRQKKEYSSSWTGVDDSSKDEKDAPNLFDQEPILWPLPGDNFFFPEEVYPAKLTPIFMAIAGNRPNVLEYLLKMGLNENKNSSSSQTLVQNVLVDGVRSYLTFAVLFNHAECVDVLLKNDPLFTKPSPLIISAHNKQVRIFEILFEFGHAHPKLSKVNTANYPGPLIDMTDEEGKTVAYHFAHSNEERNLKLAVEDYNGKFKSPREGLNELHTIGLKAAKYGIIFLICFIGVVAFAINFTYGEINKECVKFYQDMLLQPYLVIFLNTLVFMFIQSLFQQFTVLYYNAKYVLRFVRDVLGCPVRDPKDTESNENSKKTGETNGPVPANSPVETDENCVELGEAVTWADAAVMTICISDVQQNKEGSDDKDDKTINTMFGKVDKNSWLGYWQQKWEDVTEPLTVARYQQLVKQDSSYVGEGFWHQTFWVFFLLQLLNGVVAIVIAFIKTDFSVSRTYWQQYQNVSAVIVNSGISSFTVSAFLVHVNRHEQLKRQRENLIKLLFVKDFVEEQPFLPELWRRLTNMTSVLYNSVVISIGSVMSMGTSMISLGLFLAVECFIIGCFLCKLTIFLCSSVAGRLYHISNHFGWSFAFAISTVLFFAWLDGFSQVPTCLTAFSPLLLNLIVNYWSGLCLLILRFFEIVKAGEDRVVKLGVQNALWGLFIAAVAYKLDDPVGSLWLPWRALCGVLWFNTLVVIATGAMDEWKCCPNALPYLSHAFGFLIGFSMFSWSRDVGVVLPTYSYFLAHQLTIPFASVAVGVLFVDAQESFVNSLRGHILNGAFLSWWQSMLIVFIIDKTYESVNQYTLALIPTFLILFGQSFFNVVTCYDSENPCGWAAFGKEIGQEKIDINNFGKESVTAVNLRLSSIFNFYNAASAPTDIKDSPLLLFSVFPLGVSIEMVAITDYWVPAPVENQTFAWSLLAEIIIFMPALFLIAPICTHVIPAFFVYSWLSLPVLGFGFLSYFVSREKFHKGMSPLARYFLRLQNEIVSRFISIFLMQVLYNYAAILYSRDLPLTGNDYLSIIAFDYKIRTQSYCFFTTLDYNARSVIILLAWL